MDTVEFVKDRKWPNTDSRILEIPVAGLGNVAVQDWSMLDDDRFAGYLLPEPLRDRYFGLLEQDDDPPETAWDAFMDDLWEAVDAMGPEEQADWFGEIHDPATICARYWIHDGVEYLDAHHAEGRAMNGLELYDRLRPLRDAAADNAYMLGDERERGMYDGYGAVMRRCLELPEADVEDWIYGFTHAIGESGDADTEYARGRGIAMDCVIWSLGPTGRELREAIEKRLGGE